MAMVITRANFPAAADRALRKGFLMQPSGMDRLRSQFFQVMTSDQAFEKFSRNGGFGVYELKDEGAPATADSARQMYVKFLYMYTYAKEIAWTLESIEDDPKRVVRDTVKTGANLRNTMEYTLELLHWAWVNSNWTTVTADPVFTYQGTGYALGNLENPTQTPGVTYPNRTENAMQFNRATLQQIYQQFVTNLLNERGMKQGTKPDTLLVGNNDSIQAEYVLSAKAIPESADNGDNIMGKKISKFISPLLFADDGRWGMYGDKGGEDWGIRNFNRMNFEQEGLAMDSTLNTKQVSVFRTGYGAVHNKYLYVVPGA